jgi:hypothetical protein
LSAAGLPQTDAHTEMRTRVYSACTLSGLDPVKTSRLRTKSGSWPQSGNLCSHSDLQTSVETVRCCTIRKAAAAAASTNCAMGVGVEHRDILHVTRQAKCIELPLKMTRSIATILRQQQSQVSTQYNFQFGIADICAGVQLTEATGRVLEVRTDSPEQRQAWVCECDSSDAQRYTCVRAGRRRLACASAYARSCMLVLVRCACVSFCCTRTNTCMRIHGR